jgi:hypothetical protein
MAKLKRVKLYTKDDLSAWIFADYTDARSGIEVPATLDRHFVGRAKKGLPWECLVVLAILAAVKKDPNLFPHPVKHAYVIGQTAYIIVSHPKRGNQILRCVRYHHNFTRKLRKFDKFTKRTFLRHFGDQGCVIRLSKPRKNHGLAGERSTLPSRRDGSRAKVLDGAERRAADAGLIPPAVSAFGS